MSNRTVVIAGRVYKYAPWFLLADLVIVSAIVAAAIGLIVKYAG